jgi:RNA polymerase primary sigma factor
MSKLATEMQLDENYQTYIKLVKKHELLTAEEELELARRVAKGDNLAKQRLIEANLRLVVKISQKFFMQGISLMDLIQEGNIGLMHAAEKFDADKNIRFSTYASLWIKQAITRFIDSKHRSIRLPIKKEELLRRVSFAEHTLRQRLGKKPTLDEIAEEVGCSVSDVELIINTVNQPLSVEAEFGEEGNASFADYAEDMRQTNPEKEFLSRASSADTRRFLKDCLTGRERSVILHRFNFIETEGRTFKTLGDKMGISAEAVRQIEKKALGKLYNKRYELLNCVYA